MLLALQQATALGDVGQIAVTIGHINEVDPGLAQELTGMAHEFEHERILTLLEKVKNRNNDSA
jgi:hypothetical protein